jgi:hypothetical protein
MEKTPIVRTLGGYVFSDMSYVSGFRIIGFVYITRIDLCVFC